MLLSLLAMGCSDYDLNRPDDVVGPDDTGTWSDPNNPDILVEPSSLDFGGTLKDCPSPKQTVTITNRGGAELEVTDIVLDGNGSTAFGVYSDEVLFTLAPDEVREFEVDFTPEAWVEYDAQVLVVSNDPDEGEVGVDVAGRGSEDAMFEEQWEQEYFSNVDVLWIVDNSCSMSGALAAVNSNFGTFMGEFVDLGLDYHIAVVTTDLDDPTQSGKFMGSVITNATSDPEGEFGSQVDQGADGSGQEQGFGAGEAALSEPLISGTNAGFLRDDASLATIIVTDEDDDTPGLNSTGFSSWYNGLKTDPEMATFSAISGPAASACFDFNNGVDASPAPEYVNATDLTGGIHESICADEWDKALQHLSLTAAGMEYEFCLAQEPSNIGQMTVTIDATEVEYDYTDGWIYDVGSNCIIFSGEAIPGPGAMIIASYPVEGTCE
ncbi:MAG: choice-of-anchor D domain-containing protein [Proteobacteria bacterium]|nr:choice-of-anchor D domain-containing protein [Pseudomonadota bacterium]MCP4921616.1 choice-of-anchor D domain-containing protein [Pseudomonadota bacterium]